MDKGQLDMIGLQLDLANTRADRSAALGVIIGQAVAMKRFGGGGRDAADDTAQLEDDVAQFRREISQVVFDVAGGLHGRSAVATLGWRTRWLQSQSNGSESGLKI